MLGDDIMVDDAAVLADMIDTYEQYGRSVVALLGVPARGDLVLRLRRARDRRATTSCEILDIVEKPAAAEAPVEPGRHGSLRLHPGDLRRARAGRARRRRRDPAHRRHRPAARRARPSTATSFDDGRYDIGKKLDYLRATVELALDREDLGPEFRALPRRRWSDARAGLTGLGRDLTLDEARAHVLAAVPPLGPPVAVPLVDAGSGCVRRRRVVADRGGPAVRQHRHGRLRGPGGRHGRCDRGRRPVALRVVGTVAAGDGPDGRPGRRRARRSAS